MDSAIHKSRRDVWQRPASRLRRSCLQSLPVTLCPSPHPNQFRRRPLPSVVMDSAIYNSSDGPAASLPPQHLPCCTSPWFMDSAIYKSPALRTALCPTAVTTVSPPHLPVIHVPLRPLVSSSSHLPSSTLHRFMDSAIHKRAGPRSGALHGRGDWAGNRLAPRMASQRLHRSHQPWPGEPSGPVPSPQPLLYGDLADHTASCRQRFP